MAEEETKTDEKTADEKKSDVKMNRMSKRTIRKKLKGYLIWFTVLFILLLSFMFMLYLTGQQDNSFYEEGMIWTNISWL